MARDGRVVVDDAWGGDPDDPHDVFSVTKSIASTLVGIAVHDGDLALDDRVSEHVAAWDEPEHRDITVRQLLSMTSGLERPDSDYLDLASSEDRTAAALALAAVAEPGTVWAYSNGAVQVLEALLREATGISTAAFARTRLFEPLGMDRTELHIDRAGRATLAFGATTTCRDLARLGELLLRGGRWGDRTIVDPDWFDEATRSSSPLNEGYGLLWWLNREGRRLASALAISTDADEVVATGREVPGAPEDLVWALGLGDQILQVHPGTGTIVVRIGRGQALGEPNRFDQRATAKVVTDGVVD
ncbi:MAG: serine hydrolase domain-containing protein [Acidimicrobiales bacterium]